MTSASHHTLSAANAGQITIGGDLTVNRFGFGAMRITGPGIWGPPHDRDEAKRVLRRAIELDINFIDTADSYGPEVSEELIAETLYPYPKGLVIATKGGLERPGPGQWVPNGTSEHLREALEGSLRRLRLDRIDLYQFHRPDPKVPLEVSLGALAEFQTQGKIRHIGLSNVTLDQLHQAQHMIEVVSVQNRYNLTDRDSEPVLESCERQSIAFLPWRPVAGGELGAIGSALERIAQKHNRTPAQIALAWLLQRSPVMLPIPGTASVKHLEENVEAAGIILSHDDFEELATLAQ